MGDTGPCTIKVDMVAAVDSSGHRGMFVVADIEIYRDYLRRFKNRGLGNLMREGLGIPEVLEGTVP